MKLPPSNLKPDEDVLLFPTYGRFDETQGNWRFDVHGKVFEPEATSKKRGAVIALLKSLINGGDGAENGAFLEDRVRPFLVDNERGKSITIEVAGQQFLAGRSGPNGHFSSSLVLDAASAGLREEKNQVLSTQAILRDGDPRVFTGRVHLIPRRGLSVISDIDDTIKDSQVTDKKELLKNTFLRPFRSVEGMPDLYAALASVGTTFHYVSGSPWQLYVPIDTFMSDAGFPQGTLHLKFFRLTDKSVYDILASQEETKLAAIQPLLEAFPERHFILIGDSGEQDPEIYGELARARPEQIVGIFVRNVTNEARDNERMTQAFQDLPAERWSLFDDPAQISDQVIGLSKTMP